MAKRRSAPATFDRESLTHTLVQGAERLELVLTNLQVEQLIDYLQLLNKWNAAYNITAVREPWAMVALHLLDSLSVVPHIQAERLLDVGTGGGLPGIPLAIMLPDKTIALLDSNGKKTRFLFQVKQALGLDNVTVVHSRVEAYQPESGFDGVISRAFASVIDMIDGCEHLLALSGRFYAMKGVFPESELSELEKHYIVVASHPLQVPDVEGQRCLLVLSRHLTEEPVQSMT